MQAVQLEFDGARVALNTFKYTLIIREKCTDSIVLNRRLNMQKRNKSLLHAYNTYTVY